MKQIKIKEATNVASLLLFKTRIHLRKMAFIITF